MFFNILKRTLTDQSTSTLYALGTFFVLSPCFQNFKNYQKLLRLGLGSQRVICFTVGTILLPLIVYGNKMLNPLLDTLLCAWPGSQPVVGSHLCG